MSNTTFNFKGKVVLISGSSSGIGAETAILFAKFGAKVVITGRNGIKLSEVAEKCRQISPNNYQPIQAIQVMADITKENDLKLLVEATIKEFGQLDVLVNNAGVSDSRPITDSDSLQVFETVLQTNLKSAIHLTHLCAEHLAKTKGNIINISSVAAITPTVKMWAYSVSKAALDMFTKCMAVELGPKGIRVNGLNVGVVKTEIFERAGLDEQQIDYVLGLFAEKYPVGRYGEPEDIANAILYLASDTSSFITGTLMVVDGGHTAANVNSDGN